MTSAWKAQIKLGMSGSASTLQHGENPTKEIANRPYNSYEGAVVIPFKNINICLIFYIEYYMLAVGSYYLLLLLFEYFMSLSKIL